MKSSLKLLALGAVLALVAAYAPVAAAADKDQVIKDRQALMKQQGADMTAIKGFLDDKNDQAKALAAADDLGETMKKIPDVFPPGTGGPDPQGQFTTKPEIWSDWKSFLATRDAAADKVAALLTAVKGGDKAAIQTAFAAAGKDGCGACHSKYREEIKK